MRLLGIDYGTKRVGIAISDEKGEFAMAHSVLLNDGNLLEAIRKLAQEKLVQGIVLGESRNLDGKENSIMGDIRFLRDELERSTGLPVYLEPEFFTSAEAARIQGNIGKLDASAAALILKSYIDRHSNGHI